MNQWTNSRAQGIKRYLTQEKRRDFIADAKIEANLEQNIRINPGRIRDIIQKAKALTPLAIPEAAALMNVRSPKLWEEIFDAASFIKKQVYGARIVLFAPLYISSLCVNNCAYCGFRSSNQKVTKYTLAQDELESEIYALLKAGHKRLIIVFGENPQANAQFIASTVKTIYRVNDGKNRIRRVNINAPPLFTNEYKIVHKAGIGTYQIFQETYHRKTYEMLHPKNTLKGYYLWRLFSLHRAQEAGIDDVGIGALFGLYDWRYEVLGLIAHAHDLKKEFGAGSHTISFPRLNPALGTPLTKHIPWQVSDSTLEKIIAILRLSVPYTGLILTAREKPNLRRKLIHIGVSQVDAGSRIAIGGYSHTDKTHMLDRQQFQLGDTRSLDSFIYELLCDGYIPSFCTADYRQGRTGCEFMSYAEGGLIKNFCLPNAILTFQEYLLDYASAKTKKKGQQAINNFLGILRNNNVPMAKKVEEYLQELKQGKRDIYI